MNKKLLFAIIGVFLMTSGIFTLVAYIPAGTIGSPQSSPALSNIGETAATSVAVNYWTNGAVANSGTTTATLNSAENPTQQSISINDPYTGTTSIWSQSYDSSTDVVTDTLTISLGAFQYWGGSSITIYGAEFLAPYENTFSGIIMYESGNVVFTLNALGSPTYSYNFGSDSSTDSFAFIIISPTFTPSSSYGSQYVSSLSLTITETWNDGGNVVDGGSDNPPYGFATSANIGDTNQYYQSNTNAWPYSPSSVGFMYGWTYSGQAVSSTYAIPQFESSYQITWSTTQTGEIVYNGGSSTSSPVNGVLNVNTVSFNSNGASFNVPSYTFSYYLSSQNQVSSASTIQNSNPEPTYTYAQVSGTTNQASASFSFSGSTPSGAVFIPYESTQNSLSTTSTSITFTPSFTVSNPYYTYAQNQLVPSLSGASSGSFNPSSNTASPSFTGNSVTYTLATSPSWTVNLNLYGNVAPTFVSDSIVFSGSKSVATLSFDVSQSIFSGENIGETINWGDGSNIQSISPSSTYDIQVSHGYATTGTFTIEVSFSNYPNPNSNTLSPISGSNQYLSYTITLNAVPSPNPYAILTTGQYVYINWTQSNLIISSVGASVNGVSVTPTMITSTEYKLTSSIFGQSATTVSWTLSGNPFTKTLSYQYGTLLVPGLNDSYISVLQSNSITHSYPISLSGVPQVTQYPITLSGVPSGTGYYQQLLTIDPSTYGINSQGSNVLFYASNGTELYAWLQSISGTSASYWVKNFNGSTTIDMDVAPNQDYFSATGYLRQIINDLETSGNQTDYGIITGTNITGSAASLFYVAGDGNDAPANSHAVFSPYNVTLANLTASEYADLGSSNGNFPNLQQNGYFGLTTEPMGNNYLQVGTGLGGALTAFGYEDGSSYSITSKVGTAISGWLKIVLQVPYYSGIYHFNISVYSVSGTYEGSSYLNLTSSQLSSYGLGSKVYIGLATWNGVTGITEYEGNFYNSLSLQMPTFTIGSGTNMTDHVDASYLSNSITIPIPNWFNLTLKAYTNYSFTFQYNNTPLYFTYDGLINNTIYTGFFDHNLTLDIHFIALGYSGKTQSIVLERG